MCLFSPPRFALTVFISLGPVIFAYITRTWDSVKDFEIVTEVDPPLGIPVSHLKYPSWISTQIMIWEIEIHIQIHSDDSVLSNYKVCIPYSIVANLILVCDRKPIVRIHFFCIANYQCWKLIWGSIVTWVKLFSPKGRVREQCSCGKPQVAFENRDPALDKLNKSHQSTNCYKTNTESKKEPILIVTNSQ